MELNNAIAVFDSGVGGLTVVKELLRQLPQERIIYFGDTARAPYGHRSPDEVILFTREIVDYLVQFRPKLVVIACNTATAVALEETRERIPVPVMGVIQPGARAAIKRSLTGRIGVIGTEGTIASGAYEAALKEISPRLDVFSLACPTFVPLVEAGIYDTEQAAEEVRRVLAPMKQHPIDSLILGCTHYPFLAPVIAETMGPGVTLINSAEESAREISAVLSYGNLLSRSRTMPVHQFFCSVNPEHFRRITDRWLARHLKETPIVWQVPTIH